jgi:hypothetical protein
MRASHINKIEACERAFWFDSVGIGASFRGLTTPNSPNPQRNRSSALRA